MNSLIKYKNGSKEEMIKRIFCHALHEIRLLKFKVSERDFYGNF